MRSGLRAERARLDRGSSQRTRHTASSLRNPADTLVVTHPFHPLAGQRLPVLFVRRYRALGRVYTCDGGPLGNVSLPEAFTDRGLPAGQHPLSLETLAALASLIAALGALDRS